MWSEEESPAAQPRGPMSLFAPPEVAARPHSRRAVERSRYHFKAAAPAGEPVAVTDDAGEVVAKYRSFASPIAIVAVAVAGIVLAAGVAATTFLILEHSPVIAVGALMLSLFFALLITMLVPPLNVTLYRSSVPWIIIEQRSRSAFPHTTFAVSTAEGETPAILRKSLMSRLWRNRWSIEGTAGEDLGYAEDESLRRAWLRKIAGKFDRRFDADVVVRVHGREAARIHRRAGNSRPVDVLEIRGDTLDERVAIALATLVLGSEP